jgi:hypothetical protein
MKPSVTFNNLVLYYGMGGSNKILTKIGGGDS